MYVQYTVYDTLPTNIWKESQKKLVVKSIKKYKKQGGKTKNKNNM